MSTQFYTPQQSAPPPPRASRFARREKWTPLKGVRNVIAIEKLPGRLVPSMGGEEPDEVVFDLTNGLCWYAAQITANEIYRLGVASGDQIEVTVTGKKKWELLIVPLQPRLSAASAPASAPAATAGVTTSRDAQSRNGHHPTPPPPPPPPVEPAVPPPARASEMTAATACMCSAMCSAVDAVLETQAYAARKHLGLTFSEESVRAIGLSIYISACQGARR